MHVAAEVLQPGELRMWSVSTAAVCVLWDAGKVLRGMMGSTYMTYGACMLHVQQVALPRIRLLLVRVIVRQGWSVCI